MTQQSKLLAGMCLAVVLVLSGGVANATDGPESPELKAANDIARQVAAVAPSAGNVADTDRAGGTSLTVTDSVTVKVALASASKIDVAADRDGDGTRATITLPDGFTSGPGVIADDGSVVFRGDGLGHGSSGDAIAVQTLRRR
ncbi:hypothetical protein [Microbacterium sp.]|uniref:hypothetical protein n=1 Tax=Microbacterium sp. TaxID=51671 RepID=UPI0035B4D641